MWHFVFLGLIPFVLTGTSALRMAAVHRERRRVRVDARVSARVTAVRTASQPVHVDIITVLRDVMTALDPLASRHLTRISFAVPDGLTAWEVPQRVRLELHDRLQTAIRESPCGRVLVTGRQIHDEVLVSVTEDACNAAPSVLCFRTPSPVDTVAIEPAAREPAPVGPVGPWDATMRGAAQGLQKIVGGGGQAANTATDLVTHGAA